MAQGAVTGIELVEPDWPAPRRVRAVATTRRGGVSRGVHASLNLGDHVGDDPAAVAENRRRLAHALGLATAPCWLRQVHGTAVADAGGAGLLPQADAMVASMPSAACVVLTADCLPVLFCDAAGSRVAAAHAGWRGLAAGVLEATVAALVASGVQAGDLLAWIGPAIGKAAYEVGDEVRVEFSLRGREWKSPKGETRYFNSLEVWSIDRAGDGGAPAGGGDPFDDEPPPHSDSDEIPF